MEHQLVFKKNKDGSLRLNVLAVPGANKNECVGIQANHLRIRIAAVPEKGKANDELIAFLAHKLGLSRSKLGLVSGQSSRRKVVSLPCEAEQMLKDLLLDIADVSTKKSPGP